MFYHDKKLQYTVRVDTPSPLFAKMLQQASGNIAADMYANVTAEATGCALATRLFSMTDAGMKDMLRFLIARDTMHQQQWLAVIEELGGYEGVLPIPNSFPQSEELQEVSYSFFSTAVDGIEPPQGRGTQAGPAHSQRLGRKAAA